MHTAHEVQAELPVDRLDRRAHGMGQGALTLVGLGVALLAGRAVGVHAPPCPFRSITGIPCPGCGMTRLADTVAHGHVERALHADAAGVAVLVTLLVLGGVHLATVVLLRRTPPAWMRSLAVPGVLGALFAAHWVTTLVTGGITAA